MATRTIISSTERYGPGWVFAQGASGLYDHLKHMQVGELYMAAANETIASGAFEESFSAAPYPQFTPTADPSGRFYISSVTATHIYVTFTTSPAGADKTFPYKVGNWEAIL